MLQIMEYKKKINHLNLEQKIVPNKLKSRVEHITPIVELNLKR